MSDLSKDIKTNENKIQSTQDLDKILTIQNQLNSLPDLHGKKVVSSRLVDYLTQLTPAQATISDVEIDFDANTMDIKGTANLVNTNKFVDTLKFTDYKVNTDGGASGKAFKDVVLKSFSVATVGAATNQSYEISLSFDPAIFAQTKEADPATGSVVSLTIPKITSTRSATEVPTDLFAPQPAQTTTGGSR